MEDLSKELVEQLLCSDSVLLSPPSVSPLNYTNVYCSGTHFATSQQYLSP